MEGPDKNVRTSAERAIVYPVFSRRAAGLSIGINLFPDRKRCNFDCKYCEVFPFSGGVTFSPAVMESGLRKAIASALSAKTPVKDLCFSGSGEPTLSDDFATALRRAASVRDGFDWPAGAPDLVVISNGTGLLREDRFDFLQTCVRAPYSARLWLKLDAGSAGWYGRINGGADRFDRITDAIKRFSQNSQFVIQTMHCAVNGSPPPARDVIAWSELAASLAATGNVRLVQIYGKARPSPHDPVCTPLPLDSLEERALVLRASFEAAGIGDTPIAVYE